MKKIFMSLFVLGLLFLGSQAHAATLDPKVTVTANPATVSDGGFSTINWISENTNDCEIDGQQGQEGTSGSFQTSRLSKDTTYTVTCTASRMAGTAEGSVTVKVKVLKPSITVVSPNGGSTYTAGKKITVKWKSKDVPSSEKVTIEIIDEAGNKKFNLISTLNDGSEIITLDPTLVSGKYKISIKGYGVSDMSDKSFNIKVAPVVKPTLKILSPSSGKYKTGDKVTVKWKSTGIPANTTGSLEIGVRDSKGVVTTMFLFDDLVNDGSEVINIPADAPAGSNYVFLLSIIDPSNKLQQAKSGLFTIAPAKPNITVTYPNNGGEVFHSGDKIKIKWSSNLDKKSYVNIYVSDGKHKGKVVKALNNGDIGLEYTIPTTLIAGENYKVYISSLSNSSIKDSSDYTFVIE